MMYYLGKKIVFNPKKTLVEHFSQTNKTLKSHTHFSFYKSLFYKRPEPEICQYFKNKIRECLGWDSVLEILKEIILSILVK